MEVSKEKLEELEDYIYKKILDLEFTAPEDKKWKTGIYVQGIMNRIRAILKED